MTKKQLIALGQSIMKIERDFSPVTGPRISMRGHIAVKRASPPRKPSIAKSKVAKAKK